MAKKRNKDTQNGTLLVIIIIVICLVALYFYREGMLTTGMSVDITNISNLDSMQPKGVTGDQVVKHKAYIMAYDEETEQAEWVLHRLTDTYIYQGDARRTDDFRQDDLVSSGSASLDDYARSGYDRGHLAPAADFKWDDEAMSESFFMSNMSPQLPGFNRGIWKQLEELTRDWAVNEKDMYIVSGPVFKDSLKYIGPNKVAIPDYYYKVILEVSPPGYKAIGFIFPHEKSKMPLLHFAVSVDSVESFTGIDFFPALPDSLENSLEGDLNPLNWQFHAN